MALPVILRNSSNILAFSNSVKITAFTVKSSKPFSQLFNQTTKRAIVAGSKKKIDFFTVKRGMSSDHSKLWPIEKAVTVALMGLVPATFLTPNIILDDLFAIATVTHFHWGLEACVVDYVRPIMFGTALPKLTLGLLYLISAATLGSLLYYNHNCIGIGCTVRKLWEIKK